MDTQLRGSDTDRSTFFESVAVLGVVGFVSWPFVGPARYVTAFDTYAYAGPSLKVTTDAMRSGRIAGWTSDIFGGSPHLANPPMGALSPMKVFALPFETARGLGVLVALHLLVLGLGMLVLARHTLRLPAPAGLVAAAVVLLSGGTQIRMISAAQIDVLAWVPWIIVAAVAVLIAERPIRGVIGLAFSTAMMLLGGHAQLAYICVPFLGALVVGKCCDVWLAAREPSLRKRVVSRVGWLVTGGAFGVALALPQLLPSLDILKDSAFSAGRDLGAVRNPAFVLHPNGLLVGVFGDLASTNPTALTGSSETALYVGAAVLMLAAVGALLAFTSRQNRWTIGASVGSVVLGLILARGPAGLTYRTAFDLVPGFNQARVPGRWSVVSVFGLALLAAFGSGALAERRVSARQAVISFVAVSATVAALMIGPSPVPPIHLLVVWAFTALLALWPVGQRQGGKLVVLMPALIVVIELLVPAGRAPSRLLVRDEPFTTYKDELVVSMRGKPGRILSLGHDKFDDPRYMASALRPNVNSLFGLRSIDGYDGGPQVTQRWVDAMSALTPNRLNPELTLRSQLRLPLSGDQLARLGVRFALVETAAITADSQVPGWKGPIASAGTAQVWENPKWRGEAQTWFSVVSKSRIETYAYLATPESWGSETAVVESGRQSLECPGCVPVPAALKRPHPGALDVAVTTDRRALVTVSEQFSSGWSVQVDGKKKEVVEVDGFMLGVYVEPGSHEVLFRYTPPGLRLGLVGALTALLLMAALVIVDVRRGRSSPMSSLGKLEERKDATD